MQPSPPRRFLPNPYLSAAVLSWGFNFVAIKVLYGVMPPASLALSRFLIMYAAMVPICLITKESLKYPPWKETLALLGVGALSMGVYMFFFLEGAKHATAAEAAILIATSPIWTLFFEAAFGLDKFRIGSMVGGIISIAGVALVVSQGHSGTETTPIGIAFLALSAIVWALSVVITRIIGHGRSSLSLITLSMPGALVVLLPYGLMPMLDAPWPTLSAREWLMFLHVGLMAGAVGFFGFFSGVKQVGASGAMLYQFFVPPFAMVCAYFVLGQSVSWIQMVGVVIVILGVWYASWSKRKSTDQNSLFVSE